MLGGVLLALTGDPQHELAWEQGANAEERVARRLRALLDDAVSLVHDRRIPGRRANIDHIAVSPSGIWVVDTKGQKGKVAVCRPLLGEPKLTIRGADRTKYIDGLAKQVAIVEAIAGETASTVPVRGALCFVDAELPLRRELEFRGYPLLYAKQLAKRLNAPGPLAPEETRQLATELARRLPAA